MKTSSEGQTQTLTNEKNGYHVQPPSDLARTSKSPVGIAELALAQLIGQSPLFLEQVGLISKYAQTEHAVLMEGETGTGKELFARAVHNLSPRAGGPFIALNCATLAVDLFESELFGHRAGAYTHAISDAIGLIQTAKHGTLFLDEINSLPVPAQPKLLRLLQEKQFRPVGSPTFEPADVRIMAAVNVDLQAAIAAGHFRADLFHRLSVLVFNLPALRHRPGDITLLAKCFLQREGREQRRICQTFTPAALEKLERYHWPGNVRQLQNVILRAVTLSDREQIDAGDLMVPGVDPRLRVEESSYRQLKARALGSFERDYVSKLLRTYGNLTQAAAAAKTDRRVIRLLARKHEISSRP